MLKTFTTSHLHLTQPTMADLPAIIEFESKNKDYLLKWGSSILADLPNNTSVAQVVQKRLETWQQEYDEGTAVRFCLKPIDEPGHIIGFCHFTQIFYGAFKACYLGYRIDQDYAGNGRMFEALEFCINYVFTELGLHRLMANYMPTNLKSAQLLQRLGFSWEGYAKNYLLINGCWEDHILTALTHEQWQKNHSPKPLKAVKRDDGVIFRTVQAGDAKPLLPLMDQLGYPIDENTMQENIQKYNSSLNLRSWVAEKDGLVIGCIAVEVVNYFHMPDSFLRVIVLIVNEKYQRLGLGNRLMHLAEKFAVEHKCAQIELATGVQRAGAHAFYQSLGYSDIGCSRRYFVKTL